MVSRGRWPLSVRATVLIIALLAVFAGLRGLASLRESPTASGVFTDHLVVVGVTGRYLPNATDESVITAHADEVQAGAVAIRPRYLGDCAAAGWTTLGSGRRAAVGGLCDPQVADGRVTDWTQRLAAARANAGDAVPGTLAGSVSGCVQAVGPGAALAAAKPDGSVAAYSEPAAFLASGAKLDCPITLVDAGDASDQVISSLANRSDVTTVVTGIGPAAGSDDPGVQLIYRIGTTLPGWLTSDSTRRSGVVTLNDLTATVVAFGRPSTGSGSGGGTGSGSGGGTGSGSGGGSSADVSSTIDGSAVAVDQSTVTVAGVRANLAEVKALSDSVLIGYIVNGAVGAVFGLAMLVLALRRRWPGVRLVLALATVWLAGMMLPGSVSWAAASRPALVLSLVSIGWTLLLAAASLLIARTARVPIAVSGAVLTVAAFTVDAALGGVMEPGSMLNSRPIFALRWYGFGNVTFAAYASAALILAGYLAHRFSRQDRRIAAVVAILAIGFGVIICEGWPSMGTDFGGVIALTPGVLWLALVTSGLRVTWSKLALIAVGAVVVITAISVLDWRRGPGARSHLGNFVQRVIDGDATDVVIRKGVASAETLVSLLGIISIVLGVCLWIGIFRYALPRISAERFSGLRNVCIAALATAILGTLLNDGGASVWLVLTAAMTVAVAALLVDEQLAARSATGASTGTGHR